MLENKDPAIKLFGQKIPFPGDALGSAIAAGDASLVAMDVDRKEEEEEEENQEQEEEEEEEEEEENREIVGELRDEEETEQGDIKDTPADEVTEKKKEADSTPNAAETNNNNNKNKDLDATQNPKTPSIDEETAKSKNGKSENEQNDANNNNKNNNSQQEKTLKKPDKLLPCPRCNSMDTKFCYYNNYNVNQPRYFCKACQRYWTAGGTMRNVPVGAGRRKNKNSATHYRHITISEALQAARIDAPNGTHLPNLKTNGRVLSFGMDPPICDSMASVLNLAEKKVISNVTRKGFHGIEDQRVCKSVENGDDCSSGSSITVSNSIEETCKTTTPPKEPIVQSNGFLAPQVSCIPSVPWPYPWNSAVPSPALCPPGFPISFYPAAFWNCGMPANWNVPWFPSHPPPHAPNTKSPNSSPNSPTLGKHSRDDDTVQQDYSLQKEEPPRQRNGCVLVPKTLRIDDPSDAAKSSIWATLGIKNECVSGGGMFKAFKSKKEEKNHVVETSPVLRANPAALSRSLNFHENS